MQQVAEANLATIVTDVLPESHVEQIVCQGGSSKCLIEASSDVALLVVGRRGIGGFAGTGLGSTSHHSALHAKCSVAVVGDEVETLVPEPRLLVAVDGSEHATDALVWAMTSLGKTAKIVAAYSHDEWLLDELPTDVDLAERLGKEAEAKLAEVASVARSMAHQDDDVSEVRISLAVSATSMVATASVSHRSPAVEVELRVVHGDPRTTLLDVAHQEATDVIVVGTQGRTGLVGALLGSFTTHVIHHCPPAMSVIVARPTTV
jgi:nucleotide-binding universal stress UspA family protein